MENHELPLSSLVKRAAVAARNQELIESNEPPKHIYDTCPREMKRRYTEIIRNRETGEDSGYDEPAIGDSCWANMKNYPEYEEYDQLIFTCSDERPVPNQIKRVRTHTYVVVRDCPEKAAFIKELKVRMKPVLSKACVKKLIINPVEEESEDDSPNFYTGFTFRIADWEPKPYTPRVQVTQPTETHATEREPGPAPHNDNVNKGPTCNTAESEPKPVSPKANVTKPKQTHAVEKPKTVSTNAIVNNIFGKKAKPVSYKLNVKKPTANHAIERKPKPASKAAVKKQIVYDFYEREQEMYKILLEAAEEIKTYPKTFDEDTRVEMWLDKRDAMKAAAAKKTQREA